MEIQERKFLYSDEESYKKALKAAPKRTWVKERKLGGSNVSKYIPLFTQSATADMMFQQWNVIDEKYQVIANEILCTVKLQYQPDYPNAEVMYCTGTGAKPIQCDQNSVPSLFPKGKKTNALEYNAPAARSAAISNAFTTLGNLFGRNLNRDTKVNFSLDKKEEKNE